MEVYYVFVVLQNDVIYTRREHEISEEETGKKTK